MNGFCSVKLCRSDGEAVVTACGEEYRITIADWEALGLEDGGAVDDDGVQTLSECAEKLSCIKKALVYLSYRALPSLKLRQKLKTAGFCEDAIDKTLAILVKKGYVNDEELCADYATVLRDSKKYGASRLRKELYAKGFSRECVDSAVEEAFEDYHTEAQFGSEARIYRDRIAITSLDGSGSGGDRVAAAKAADKLLTVRSVQAAFALIRIGEVVHISTRSDGSINVQLILEKIGGGGHFDVAGAALAQSELADAERMLKEAIDDYFDGEKK
jgi:SOS response regulatory protein OraA/RecX